MTRVAGAACMAVESARPMLSMPAAVVTRLRVFGGRGWRVAVRAGVPRRGSGLTRWHSAVARRDAAVTGRGHRRTTRVVARSGHALKTPEKPQGQRNDQDSFTPPDLCATGDRGVLRLKMVPLFSSA